MKTESSAISTYNGMFGQQGWVCPKCGRVYSPFTQMCLHCKPNNTNSFSNANLPNTRISEEESRENRITDTNMSKIKAAAKLRNSCMNAECFHPKVQVIDLNTALECVSQATTEGRKEGADNLIEQASANGQKKHKQGMDFMKYKAIEAFKENCQHPKDAKGCECELCVRWVAGHCELLDGFIEKLNS